MQVDANAQRGDAPVVEGGGHRRLFFALWPDADVRDALADAAAALRAQCPSQRRWTDPMRYHVTLRFLGDCNHAQQAIALQAAAAVRVAPFDVVIDRAGSFPGRSTPWWLGCTTPSPGLLDLHDQLGRALAGAGMHLPPAELLVPHITILRGVRSALPPSRMPPVHWRVHAFVLVESVRGESAYHPLARWPLSAPAQPLTDST